MFFKNVPVHTGDIVSIRAKSIPLRDIHAAVIEVKDHTLEVMSTLLVPFGHNGLFSEDDIEHISVIQEAAAAIPIESRGKVFQKNQLIAATIFGKTMIGQAVAAFDGIVVAKCSDGKLVTAGALIWRAA